MFERIVVHGLLHDRRVDRCARRAVLEQCLCLCQLIINQLLEGLLGLSAKATRVVALGGTAASSRAPPEEQPFPATMQTNNPIQEK